jgi:hypothetical protein
MRSYLQETARLFCCFRKSSGDAKIFRLRIMRLQAAGFRLQATVLGQDVRFTDLLFTMEKLIAASRPIKRKPAA